jgi:hypothetical protein
MVGWLTVVAVVAEAEAVAVAEGRYTADSHPVLLKIEPGVKSGQQ